RHGRSRLRSSTSRCAASNGVTPRDDGAFRRPVEETMTRWLNAATAGLLGMLTVMTHAPARAAEIVVLTNLGVVSAVRDLAPAFERASGHKVIVSFELRQCDDAEDQFQRAGGSGHSDSRRDR